MACRIIPDTRVDLQQLYSNRRPPRATAGWPVAAFPPTAVGGEHVPPPGAARRLAVPPQQRSGGGLEMGSRGGTLHCWSSTGRVPAWPVSGGSEQMSFFPDLGRKSMVASGEHVRAVGWLHPAHPYTK